MLLPHYSCDRELARAVASGAAGEEALLGTREMGRKIMEEQPIRIISCLVGVAVVSIADNGLVKFYQQQGRNQDVSQWEKRRTADREWGESVKQAATAIIARVKQLGSTTRPERVDAAVSEIMALEKRTVEALLTKRPA
jgi:hypothetical protein